MKSPMRKMLFLMLLLLAAGLVPEVSAARGNCPIPTAAYPSIAAAVADDGCRVIAVAAGTYDENLSLARDLTIRGAPGGETILDGSGLTDTIYVAAGTRVTLEQLVVVNDEYRGLNAIYNEGDLTLKRSTVRDSRATAGAAIFNWGTLLVRESTFVNNDATNLGGAILSLGPLTIRDSTFRRNRADWGGAIAVRADATIVNTTFERNRARRAHSGAISVENDAHITIARSYFTGNTAGLAGGIYVNINAQATIRHSLFEHNWANLDGGALVNHGNTELLQTTIRENAGGAPGGILNYGALVIRQGAVVDNDRYDVVNRGGSVTLVAAEVGTYLEQ